MILGSEFTLQLFFLLCRKKRISLLVQLRKILLTVGGSGICEMPGGSGICEHNRRSSRCKQCGGSSICEHNRIRCGQAMRRVEHMRAQPQEKRVQAVRRVGHLRAQPPKKQVQAVRRTIIHPFPQEFMQALRHLALAIQERKQEAKKLANCMSHAEDSSTTSQGEAKSPN